MKKSSYVALNLLIFDNRVQRALARATFIYEGKDRAKHAAIDSTNSNCMGCLVFEIF